MKKATLFVRRDPQLLANRIFSGQPLYGMKSDNYPFIALRSVLAEKFDFDLCTQDIHSVEESEFVIALDETAFFRQYTKQPNQILYLIISEPDVYCPDNWKKENHGPFDRVFNYEREWADGQKYRHYTFPIEFSFHAQHMEKRNIPFEKRKLCVMIAGAVSVGWVPRSNRSLLFERFRAIRWFAENQPERFDFFGRNIDQNRFADFKGAGVLKRLKLGLVIEWVSRRNRNTVSKVYRGAIEPLQKLNKLQEYRFSICYENSRDINGIVSEKIFDCFAAGVVPVYWGARDIHELVPADCYIDRTKFSNYRELYEYLSGMTEQEFLQYANAIEQFMSSTAISRFSVDTYVDTILSPLAHDLLLAPVQ